MNVQEAAAAYQAAADKKNATDAQLADLHAQERALSEKIGRAVADGAIAAALATPKAQRDEARARIEDLESASVHLDTDLLVAEEDLKAAKRSERRATVSAAIERARETAAQYGDALTAFVQARGAMRVAASALPGQEAAVQQLIEDTWSYQLTQTPSNPAYGRSFADLVEPYLQTAGA